jgi:hypothetical protein
MDSIFTFYMTGLKGFRREADCVFTVSSGNRERKKKILLILSKF